VKLQIIRIASDGCTNETSEDIAIESLVGDYHQGDGLGYNLNLKLNRESTFDCTCTGCLGVYGTSSGTWSAEAGALSLIAVNSDGMMKSKPIEKMHVISFQDHVLLLQDQDRRWFDERGPDTFRCFHKQNATSAIQQESARRLLGKSEK
jgi:hypothetical protein